MAFNVKPFKDVLAMTKEKIDEALAPIRARSAKAKADLESARIEERMVALGNDIHQLCTEKELNLDRIISKIDDYELAERKKAQIAKIVSELFPEKEGE